MSLALAAIRHGQDSRGQNDENKPCAVETMITIHPRVRGNDVNRLQDIVQSQRCPRHGSVVYQDRRRRLTEMICRGTRIETPQPGAPRGLGARGGGGGRTSRGGRKGGWPFGGATHQTPPSRSAAGGR